LSSENIIGIAFIQGGDNIDRIEYLTLLERRLGHLFHVQRDYSVLGESFHLYAQCEIHNERYFASKNVKLWRADNYEYTLVRCYEEMTQNHLLHLTDFLKQAVDSLVQPYEEHMTSIITGVIVLEEEPVPEIIRIVERFNYQKSFKMGLQGWCDIRLILVVPSLNQVYCNRKAKEVKPFYHPVRSPKKKSLIRKLREVLKS